MPMTRDQMLVELQQNGVDTSLIGEAVPDGFLRLLLASVRDLASRGGAVHSLSLDFSEYVGPKKGQTTMKTKADWDRFKAQAVASRPAPAVSGKLDPQAQARGLLQFSDANTAPGFSWQGDTRAALADLGVSAGTLDDVTSLRRALVQAHVDNDRKRQTLNTYGMTDGGAPAGVLNVSADDPSAALLTLGYDGPMTNSVPSLQNALLVQLQRGASLDAMLADAKRKGSSGLQVFADGTMRFQGTDSYQVVTDIRQRSEDIGEQVPPSLTGELPAAVLSYIRGLLNRLMMMGAAKDKAPAASFSDGTPAHRVPSKSFLRVIRDNAIAERAKVAQTQTGAPSLQERLGMTPRRGA